MNNTFESHAIADDLREVHRIYAQFFTELIEADWDKPVKGGSNEWTLHETVAHLCALNGAGLEGIQHTLLGETYTFVSLDTRNEFKTYKRMGFDEHLGIPMKDLCAKLLDILKEVADIARNLTPSQAELTAPMAIYNRPFKIVEALSTIMVHIGLFHSAQVAESADNLPLRMQLSPEIRHRMIGLVMRAFSLTYRFDIGSSLRTTLVFRVDSPGGGEWHVNPNPEAATSSGGALELLGLVIQLRGTAVFCPMLTSRLIILMALISGDMKLHGDLRMNPLTSVDTKPRWRSRRYAIRARKSPVKSTSRIARIWKVEPANCCLSEISKQLDGTYPIHPLALSVSFFIAPSSLPLEQYPILL